MKTVVQPTQPIRIQISDVMDDVRNSFVNVLASVPGAPSRVSEVERVLGLRKTMAWRVVQMCAVSDPLQAAEHMPGPEGVLLILEAAHKAGASKESLEALRSSTERFRSLVGNHAPTRPALRRLVAGLSENGRERFDMAQRKAAVEAASAIWGVHAKVQYRLGIIWRDPAATSSAADLAVISGFFGLSRLRENVTWELNHGTNMRSHGSGLALGLVTRPLDESITDANSAPLLTPFCSGSPGAIERTTNADKTIVDRLLPGPVGMSAASNVLFGEMLPGLMAGLGLPEKERQDDILYFTSRLRTPCDTAVLELHFQRDLIPTGAFGAILLNQMQTAVPFPNSAGQVPPTLPLDVEVERLGRADQAVPLLEIPEHSKITRWVYQRLGLAPAGFDVFRLRLRFPPIPTSLVMGTPLRPDLRSHQLGGV
jgi:hypothetical protein